MIRRTYIRALHRKMEIMSSKASYDGVKWSHGKLCVAVKLELSDTISSSFAADDT